MNITVNIPDSATADLANAGPDPARALLEAFALEGYRAGRLSEAGVRRLLGFETRDELDGFLKQHGAFMHTRWRKSNRTPPWRWTWRFERGPSGTQARLADSRA